MPERQADSEERILGPAKSAPLQAVAGFARKQGVSPESLTLETTAKGDYYTLVRKVSGRLTKDILAEALPGLILRIYFPKTMYWTGKSGPRFIRPIRWIVALLGEEIVPFEIAGVRSGNLTSGHRRLGAREIVVTTADYERRLRDHYVILSAEERRNKIAEGMAGMRVKPDNALLETLVYLTEYPTPITGSFDPQFLELPEEVLVTVMRHHQKYFSVEDADGRLAPRFVAVMNIDADPEGFVRRGNERVLRARFNDARFFWETDQKKKLADRLPDLAHVTFQAKLGSYLEKTERMMALAKELGGDADAVRAAELVEVRSHLPNWSRSSPNCRAWWAACTRAPRASPSRCGRRSTTTTSRRAWRIRSRAAARARWFPWPISSIRCAAVSRVGMIPTGSRDPFALRRAAQGRGQDPRGRPHFDGFGAVSRRAGRVRTRSADGKTVGATERAGRARPLQEFFEDRVRYYFKDIRGFQYDEVNAAMAAGWSNLVDLEARLVRIQNLRPTPDFEPLAASFKRIRNILEQAGFTGPDGEIDEALLEAGPEKDLYEEYGNIAGQPIENAIAPAAPQGGSVLRQGAGECAGRARPAKPFDATQHAIGGVFHHSGLF